MPAPPVEISDDVIDRLLAELESGKSLSEICREPGMPARGTVHRWANADDELAVRIRDAREAGYHAAVDQLVEDARNAKDAHLGRLAFEAGRWRISKLSLAFADKPLAIGVAVSVGADDAFGAFAAALDQAAATIASSGTSTRLVAGPREAGPGDAAG